MTTLQNINIVLDLCGVFFCVLAATVIAVGFHVDSRIRKYILIFFGCLFVVLCSDVAEILLEAFAPGEEVILQKIFYFVENLFLFMLSFFFLRFLLYLLKKMATGKIAGVERLAMGIAKLLLLLKVATLCLSQWFGWLYYFDSDGICRRGSMYILPLLYLVAFLALDAILLIRCWNQLPYRVVVPLCCCILLPLVAIVVQIYIPEYRFLLFSRILSSITVLVFAFYVQVGQYIANEKQVADMQATVMLSQIQPHFLHNALVSIAQLCEKNPKAAKKAIIAFSEYLRENMDSLKEREPVPFVKELEHIKNYLYLEKMRFGDDLETELDIQAVDFKIPVLSLQPLVENAIRHGVGMREEGGKVTISSREREDCFEILVQDDGVGFDTTKALLDQREHVGLKNVRRRLWLQCGGRLNMVSSPGKGSTVTIVIPKKPKEGVGRENFSGRR